MENGLASDMSAAIGADLAGEAPDPRRSRQAPPPLPDPLYGACSSKTRSPARIGAFSRFSAGVSGQDQSSL